MKEEKKHCAAGFFFYQSKHQPSWRLPFRIRMELTAAEKLGSFLTAPSSGLLLKSFNPQKVGRRKRPKIADNFCFSSSMPAWLEIRVSRHHLGTLDVYMRRWL